MGAGVGDTPSDDEGATRTEDVGGAAAPAPPTFQCTRADCRVLIEVPPDVTAEDLASFRPSAPSLSGEPTGFGVVGAPTNVVAAASEQYLTGNLLGWDVSVRFVPAGYVFDYGDGTTMRSATGGTSWSSLGQPQFTPTSTSHAYGARGTYSVGVTVQYSASVNFGSATWRPVTGFVSSSTGGYDVRVVEVRTALVEKTCIENPTGPSC